MQEAGQDYYCSLCNLNLFTPSHWYYNGDEYKHDSTLVSVHYAPFDPPTPEFMFDIFSDRMVIDTTINIGIGGSLKDGKNVKKVR